MDRQLDGIAAAAERTGTETWVMAPMVATVAEAADFAAKVRERGLKAGVMVEIPSAALLAHRMLEVVDFLSIGTNDLTQYAMAADRMATDLAHLTDPWQPAVLQLIAITAHAGTEAGKPVGVCGEAAADPLLATALIGMGISSLSMAARAVRPVGAQLGKVTLETCEAAAEAALGARRPDGRPRRGAGAARALRPRPRSTVHLDVNLTRRKHDISVRPLPRGRSRPAGAAPGPGTCYGAGEENMGKDGQPELVPVPEPDADHMLVRIDSVGLCFSDVKIMRQGGSHPKLYDRDLAKEPTRLGHEVSLTVIEVGDNLAGPLPRRPAAGRAARHLPGRQEHGLRLHHPRRTDPVPPHGRRRCSTPTTVPACCPSLTRWGTPRPPRWSRGAA